MSKSTVNDQDYQSADKLQMFLLVFSHRALDILQNSTAFLTASLVIRVFEAVGSAGFSTACFSIIACEFPDAIATTFVRHLMMTHISQDISYEIKSITGLSRDFLWDWIVPWPHFGWSLVHSNLKSVVNHFNHILGHF